MKKQIEDVLKLIETKNKEFEKKAENEIKKVEIFLKKTFENKAFAWAFRNIHRSDVEFQFAKPFFILHGSLGHNLFVIDSDIDLKIVFPVIVLKSGLKMVSIFKKHLNSLLRNLAKFIDEDETDVFHHERDACQLVLGKCGYVNLVRTSTGSGLDLEISSDIHGNFVVDEEKTEEKKLFYLKFSKENHLFAPCVQILKYFYKRYCIVRSSQYERQNFPPGYFLQCLVCNAMILPIAQKSLIEFEENNLATIDRLCWLLEFVIQRIQEFHLNEKLVLDVAINSPLRFIFRDEYALLFFQWIFKDFSKTLSGESTFKFFVPLKNDIKNVLEKKSSFCLIRKWVIKREHQKQWNLKKNMIFSL